MMTKTLFFSLIVLFPFAFYAQNNRVKKNEHRIVQGEKKSVLTPIFNEQLGTGEIRVSLGEKRGIAPFHYIIDTAPISDMHEMYRILNVSEKMDSVSFFRGNIPDLNYQFTDLEVGKYYVSVFDSKGDRIVNESCWIQENMKFLTGKGITVHNNQITASKDGSSGVLNVYIDQDSPALIELNSNGEGSQFIGLTRKGKEFREVSDVDYGIMINEHALRVIQSGRQTRKEIILKKDDSFLIRIEKGVISFRVNENVIQSLELPKKYGYALGVGMSESGKMKLLPKPLKPVSLIKGYYFRSNVSQYFKCDDLNAEFTFSVTSLFPPLFGVQVPITYTVVNQTTGQVVVPTTVGTTSSSILVSSSNYQMEPGIYSISGTISTLSPIYFTGRVYLGYETLWDNVLNYNQTPNSYSVIRPVATSTTFSEARSKNILPDGQDGWIQFRPTSFNNYYLGTNKMRLAAENSVGTSTNFSEEYLGFSQFFNNRYMFMGFGQSPWWTQIPNNALIRIVYSNNVKVYANGAFKGQFPRNQFSKILRAQSLTQNDGFRHVITSFGCTPRQSLETVSHAELKKSLDGGIIDAVEGIVRFTFDHQYEVSTSTFLAYEITSESNTVMASSDHTGVVSNGATPLNYQLEDNRYDLDLSTVSGLTSGDVYVLTVLDSKGNKKYLKFRFNN